MFFTKAATPTDNLVDQVAQSTDHAIKATHHVADEVLESLADTVLEMRQQAAPAVTQMTHAGDRISAMAHQGVDTLCATARQTSDATVKYIKHEPVKAMLIAASTGAVLMGLLSLMGYSRGRG